jgi:hypothetical protein
MRDEEPSEGETWTRAFTILAQVLIPGALVLVGLVLSKPYSRWLIAALAVAMAVVASTVVALLLSRYYRRRIEAVVRSTETAISGRIAEVSRVALVRAEARDGLTQEKLSEYESWIDVETIWIVGDDFKNEATIDSPFLKVIKRNIHERGVRYVYVAPERPERRLELTTLRTELGLDEGDTLLRTEFLSVTDWERMPYTAGNFTIYDPARRGHAPKGYCWDPGGDGKSFIELRHDINRWISKIRQVCPALEQDAPREDADAANEQ